MVFPSRDNVERLKKEYPEGIRVELVSMNDPYNQKLIPGSKGTVTNVDDAGTIHVSWDCGSSLGIAYGEDKCRKLPSVTTICYGIKKVWDNREDAIKEFYEGMLCCDGAEKERYTNIYLKLMEGLDVCDDEPF